MSRRIVPKTNGTSLVEFSFSLEEAPVPERRYVADATLAVKTEDHVQIIFGQFKVGGRDLRSMVVIKMSFDAVRAFLNSCVQFTPSLRAAVEHGGVHVPPCLVAPREEPSQAVVLAANLIAAAFSGREAALDLYNSSPFAVRALRKDGTQLALDPVLRIDLSIGALMSMMEQLGVVGSDLPPDVGAAEAEEP